MSAKELSFPAFLGQRIFNRSGTSVGRIGAIVADGKGDLYALGAREAIGSDRGEFLYDERKLVIGELVKEFDAEELVGQFASTIGAFRIANTSTVFRRAGGWRLPPFAAEPTSVLSSEVKKFEPIGDMPSGVVVAVDTSIGLTNPRTDGRTVLRGAIEVSFDANETIAVSDIDAGSLVYNEELGAVGLVIAGDNVKCYLAPLAVYLRVNDLRLMIGESQIIVTNEVPTNLVAAQSKLRMMKAGAKLLRDDIEVEKTFPADAFTSFFSKFDR